MKQTLLSLCLFLFISRSAFSQVDCSNIGFEKGNTDGWKLSYGTVDDQNQKVVYLNETSGSNSAEFAVTSIADGNDPKITSISQVAPGSSHSIRIGNTTTGTHFSRIKADYLVTAENTLFQYKFAVLLQNTGSSGGGGGQNHEAYQKPGFNIQISDANGDELTCSNYDIQLQGANTVDGFQTSGNIQYRDWTTGAIDLRNYIGKTITIMVTAHGCTERGHFGYAYFDAECLKSEIKAASDCPDSDGNLTLVAPEGFGSYKWSNGATGQQAVVKAKLGDEYNVKLVPLGSLEESCALQLDYKIAYKKTSASIERTICDGEVVAVGDTVYRTTGIFTRTINLSNVCDSTVTLKLTVNPVAKFVQDVSICMGESFAVGDTVYRTSGTFLKNIPQSTGCDSLVVTNLTVVELNLSLTPDLTIMKGDSVQIHAIADPAGNFQYLWSNGNNLSCTDCPEPWVKPDVSSRYTISVSDTGKVCDRKGSLWVSVKPCGISIPDAFSPNNDQKNEVFFVYGNSCVKLIKEMMIYNRWGEVIYQQQNFTASDPSYGWRGTYRGTISDPGVYPYKIQVELKDGHIVSYKGVVNLLR